MLTKILIFREIFVKTVGFVFTYILIDVDQGRG